MFGGSQFSNRQRSRESSESDSDSFPFMQKQPKKLKSLFIDEDDQILDPALPPRSQIYHYKTADDDMMKMTSNYKLTERISELVWNTPETEANNFNRAPSNPPSRYFSKLKVCRQCKKDGHLQRECNKILHCCLNCLDKHRTDQCSQLSFNQEKGKDVCSRCHRNGHRAEQCYYLAYKTSTDLFAKQTLIPIKSLTNIECENCHETGHYGCKYSSQRDRIYG